jgi:hypothetical protein
VREFHDLDAGKGEGAVSHGPVPVEWRPVKTV